MMNTKKGFWIVSSLIAILMIGLLVAISFPIFKTIKHNEIVLTEEKNLQVYYNLLENSYENCNDKEAFFANFVGEKAIKVIYIGGQEVTFEEGYYIITRSKDNSKLVFTYFCNKGDHSTIIDTKEELKPSKQNPSTTPRSNQETK